MKGKLIVIDGTDGAGKTTQAQLLIQRLRRAGHRVQYADFPQYYHSFFGRMIGRFQMGKYGDPVSISPYLASLLYAGDRFEEAPRIRKWLQDGDIVIANRYTSSNAAHQGGKLKGRQRTQYLEWLYRLEHDIFGVPVPDTTIFLDVPPEISMKLVFKKGGRGYTASRKSDKVERDKSYQQGAIAVYRQLAKSNKNWQIVGCVVKNELLLPQQIHEKVWKIVEKLVK